MIWSKDDSLADKQLNSVWLLSAVVLGINIGQAFTGVLVESAVLGLAVFVWAAGARNKAQEQNTTVRTLFQKELKMYWEKVKR